MKERFFTFIPFFLFLVFLIACSGNDDPLQDPNNDPGIEDPSGNDPDPNPDPDPDPDPGNGGGKGWTVDTLFKATSNLARHIKRQPDGRMIVASDTQIERINADGSQDESFSILTVEGGEIKCIALQQDGKILVGGDFETIGGLDHPLIARINANGSVDESFAKQPLTGTSVNVIAVQPDGKILMGGDFYFNTYIQVPDYPEGTWYVEHKLVRLHADGSRDSDFSVNHNGTTTLSSHQGSLQAISLEEDGSVVIAGRALAASVYNPDYIPVYHIAKIKNDGTLDTSLDLDHTFHRREKMGDPLLPANLTALIRLSTGDYMVGGDFRQLYNPINHEIKCFARVSPTGAVDTEFGIPFGFVGDFRLFPVNVLFEFSPDQIMVGTQNPGGLVTPLYAIGLDGAYVLDFWHPHFAIDPQSNKGYMLRQSEVWDIVRDSDNSVILAGFFIQEYDRFGINPVQTKGLLRLVKKD